MRLFVDFPRKRSRPSTMIIAGFAGCHKVELVEAVDLVFGDEAADEDGAAGRV